MSDYFTYDGRIGRLDYFAQVLVMLGCVLVIFIAIGLILRAASDLGRYGADDVQHFLTWIGYPLIIFWLGSYPGVKRLHDCGYSGAVYLWGLLPVINLILVFWCLFAPGDEEDNEYGTPLLYEDYIGGAASAIGKQLKPVAEIASGLSGKMRESMNPYDISDADVYTAVAKEMDEGKIDQGLWAKAVSMSEGVEQVAKAKYIKLRVSQIKAAVDPAK